MLCKLVELSKVKCERYWPTEVGETEVYGDYEIKLEEERPYLEDDFVLRLISMKDQRTSETRNLWQLHYREWPDHGCPDGEKQLLNMLEVMETIHNEHSEGAPVLVHCSAGVGRTGTIIAINDIREKIKAETLQSIDIFRLVCFLRTQRSSMVQTPDQYWFVHKCICAYARRQLGMPEIERNDQTSVSNWFGFASAYLLFCSCKRQWLVVEESDSFLLQLRQLRVINRALPNNPSRIQRQLGK